MTCEQARAVLDRYLYDALAADQAGRLRCHLDRCTPCWDAWNRLRWDAATGTPLYAELAEYLGDAFIPYLDSSRLLAAEWDRARPRTGEQVRRFYRQTPAYLYNQVIWHASGNRPRYVQAALPILSAHAGATILDYGCGIGEDVLMLNRAGFDVVACDLPSPPIDFLTWRAPRHGYPHQVYDPIDLPSAPTPAVLWVIDTLDHLADIDTCLGHVLRTVDLVVSENLLVDRRHGRQGFHHRRPLRHIAAVLGRHGLHRAAADSTSTPLTVWTRRPETAGNRATLAGLRLRPGAMTSYPINGAGLAPPAR